MDRRRALQFASLLPLAWSLLVLAFWLVLKPGENAFVADDEALQLVAALLFLPVALSWIWFLRLISTSSRLSVLSRFLWIAGMFFLPVLTMPLYGLRYGRDEREGWRRRTRLS
jgi:hypothetical protein